MHFLKASHLGPTLLVTTLSFLFAQSLFSFTTASLVAMTIFSGQLLVGWTNELIDYQSDLAANRQEKPLVAGTITLSQLRKVALLDLPICVALSLFGPLGFKGGSLHLLGVGCGVGYNFYFKRTLLSPLPYAVAFAALPAMPYLGADVPVPIWMVLVGGLFGVVAHFANVLKDLESDQALGIQGLPQRCGDKASLAICAILLAAIVAAIVINKSEVAIPIGIFTLATAALALTNPKKYAFPAVMALALVSVLAIAL